MTRRFLLVSAIQVAGVVLAIVGAFLIAFPVGVTACGIALLLLGVALDLE